MLIMASIILSTEARVPLTELELVDFVLITLASWRLTRLFVYDMVTKFVREQFLDVVKVGRKFALEKPKTGPRRTLADLFGCPWCFGVWATALMSFLYLISEWFYYVTIILALSAVATFLQILTNLVGHKAEELKNRNQ